jgi:hypothetical protein
MKAISLVSCVLLSILIILLLSTAVQATEYREVNTTVKAVEILKHIKNCEEVNLTDCRISGDLNINEIKLKTVPNSDKIESFYTKNCYFCYEHPEKLSVIESNIKIRNSIFENNVSFSNVSFKEPVDFSYTEFNDSADFSETIFKNSTNFYGTTFEDTVDFSDTIFKNSTKFSWTTFEDTVDFSRTKIYGDAYFMSSFFHDAADFENMRFEGITGFLASIFDGHTSFQRTVFNDSVLFQELSFLGTVNFADTTFNGDTNFNQPQFYSSVDFSNIIFNNRSFFYMTRFENTTNFQSTIFKNSADFSGTIFKNSADFKRTKFGAGISFIGPEPPENIITDGDSCETFMKYYESKTRYEDSDTIYYNYRKASQETKDLKSLSKWSDVLSWISCGYGVRPFRIIYLGGFVVILCAFFYWRGPGIYKSTCVTEKKSIVSFWDALYFSTSTFTTLGSVDWYPRDNFRKLVTLEGLLGWIALGIFMATLTNILIRS